MGQGLYGLGLTFMVLGIYRSVFCCFCFGVLLFRVEMLRIGALWVSD